jgi:1-acyl-sn-glycerol-3-phosphate acyltransferase
MKEQAGRLLVQHTTFPAGATSNSRMRCKLFFPFFVLATILMGFFSSIAALFDRSGRTSHLFARTWSRFIFWGVGVRVHLSGAENIPKGQPVIFAANHQSTMDIPAMFGFLPTQFRIMAKQVLFLIPFLGWHLYLSGNIPIDRKDARRAHGSIFKAAARIKKGISILVFLEGTRSRDGKIHRFKRGSFTLARKLGVPLVPIAIRGTFELMPADAWISKSGDVSIVIFPPIQVPAEGDFHAQMTEVRERLISAGLEEAS